MNRLITADDFIDTYAKIKQRGLGFISSKFNFSSIERTKSAFNEVEIQSSNWWIIPIVKDRWNKMITNDDTLEYEEFTVQNFLKPHQKLKMLSLGSGICSHELRFASHEDIFEDITCIDISNHLMDEAKETADANNLKNISFLTQSIYDYSFPEDEFDIVFFHAALHHFKNMEDLLGNKIRRTLKPGGQLIINEYVGPNRLQYPKYQVRAINEALQLIPKKFRKRFKLDIYKNKISGSGLIRMILADPSECVESQNILPCIHEYFDTNHEAFYGGSILMGALKDISHHFVNLDMEKQSVMNHLFEYEDNYLQQHPSDFVFGIYGNKK